MENNLLDKIIEEWVNNLLFDEKIIKLAEKVRDIPYGSIGSRDPADVYEKNMGTCSGKHELLKNLYQHLGIEVQDFISMHKFNDLPVKFSPEIQEILDRGEIWDPHNFFKILINGKWITVDIAWNIELKKFGFPINEDWDGRTDMNLCVVPAEIFEVKNSLVAKKELVSKLDTETQNLRKEFLSKMTNWLSNLVNKN